MKRSCRLAAVAMVFASAGLFAQEPSAEQREQAERREQTGQREQAERREAAQRRRAEMRERAREAFRRRLEQRRDDRDGVAQEIEQLRERAADLRAQGREDEAERLIGEARQLQQQIGRRTPRDEGRGERPGMLERLLEIREQITAARRAGRNEEAEELRRESEELRRNWEHRFRAREGRPREEMVGGEVERRIEHLRAAAENLAAAGIHDQARLFAEQAEQLQREHQPRRSGPERGELIAQLRELRGEVERLRDEVAQLRNQLQQLRGTPRAGRLRNLRGDAPRRGQGPGDRPARRRVRPDAPRDNDAVRDAPAEDGEKTDRP